VTERQCCAKNNLDMMITDGSGGSDETFGRIMALDLGEKRIGIALSDPSHILARSLAVIPRKSRSEDFHRIREFVEKHRVLRLVIGLPTLLAGGEGQKAAWVRDYADHLSRTLSIEIVFWDESFTTVDAEKSLRLRGISKGKRRERVDAVAAAFILQSYLDGLQSREFGQ